MGVGGGRRTSLAENLGVHRVLVTLLTDSAELRCCSATGDSSFHLALSSC